MSKFPTVLIKANHRPETLAFRPDEVEAYECGDRARLYLRGGPGISGKVSEASPGTLRDVGARVSAPSGRSAQALAARLTMGEQLIEEAKFGLLPSETDHFCEGD
jgi:hypothetical protein